MEEAKLSVMSARVAVPGLDTKSSAVGLVERFRLNIVESGRAPLRTAAGFAIGWIAFALILWVIPRPAGLSQAGMATLAVMVWACIMWITEAVPVGVSGLLIPMLLVMSGSTTPFPKAASGFTTPVVFLCLAAFIFAAIMQAAGLDRRVALKLLNVAKVHTVNGVIWVMFVANFVLSFIIPAANARAATLLPVVNGITRMFGDTDAERNAKKAIVIQTLVYGSMICGLCIMTAHLPNLVLVGLFESQLKLQISYLDWFKLRWPYLGMFVVTQWWVQHYFKTRSIRIPGGRETIARESASLPRTSATEWMIMAAFATIAILWMTEDQHSIKSHNAALIGLALLFIPGVLGFKWKDIQDRTIWGTMLLLAGALSLSGAMSSSGLAVWLSDLIHPLAHGQAWWMILLILMVGTHVIRLGMLSNVAAITMIAPILVALAPKLGLHTVAFTMLVSDTDTFAYILPTQITAAVIAYSSGTFSTADYAKVGIVSVAIAICYGIVVMVPWFAYMGLPVWDPTAPWPFNTIR